MLKIFSTGDIISLSKLTKEGEGGIIKNFNLQMNGQMNEPITDYQKKMLMNFLNIAEELKEWQKYKNILDYKVYMEERNYASNENKQKPCCNRQQNIQ